MALKAYLLLEVKDGRGGRAVEVLRRQRGVMVADLLDGPPDIIAVVQAVNRQSLARLTVQALASVEEVTEELHLLPTTARRGIRVEVSEPRLEASA